MATTLTSLIPTSPLLFLLQLTITASTLFTTYILYLLYLRPILIPDPLDLVPGPAPESVWLGNLQRIFDEEPGVPHTEWINTFGPAVKYKGIFGNNRLMFTDPAALNHILLSRAYDYPKPNEVRGNLSRILGKGLLFAEGEDHRRQKRIMVPAFAPSHLRALTPIFFEQSYKLRDQWLDLINSSTSDLRGFANASALSTYNSTKPTNEIVLEVSSWLSRLTLDIIGLAGFGYHFDALSGTSENKLAAAFSSMLTPSASKNTGRRLLIGRGLGFIMNHAPFDVTKFIPSKRIKAITEGFVVMEEESKKIVLEKKEVLRREGIEGVGNGKDLMTLLLKSNVGEGAKMSDAELQGQMTTFILAGHETTSTALMWALYVLARHPDYQTRLRKEVHEARRTATEEARAELEGDELSNLPFLDAVVREILRLESPASLTIRSAAKDDLIPLSSPIPSALGKGHTLSHIPVKAGQEFAISIAAVNRSKSIWGEDAEVFRPERWLSDDGREGGVGVWARQLTFLAGPRACIGYKFALLEFKAILSILIDNFTFAERSPDLAIERRSSLVTRPLIVGEEELGHRMPLRVGIAKREE